MIRSDRARGEQGGGDYDRGHNEVAVEEGRMPGVLRPLQPRCFTPSWMPCAPGCSHKKNEWVLVARTEASAREGRSVLEQTVVPRSRSSWIRPAAALV